ncbi:MAG: protein kinase, partial [Acidobacteriota bacterium]
MTRDTPTQPSPTHVGPYRIETRIGRGGMGEVYRAHDARLDRPVALKRVRAGKVSDQARDRLQREARALARVRHPTVVEIHDWVEDESGDWLVMEWLDGRSLRDALTSAPPATERALAITRELASGLAAIHDQGIVHRDIKPDNVMVLSDGSLKILDLGLAKRVASKDGRTLTETISDDGQLLGTVRFMSPEQAGGQRLDARSDLFSLGVLLYEMLTGVAPFGGDTPVETLTRICTWREVPAIEHDPALPRAVSDWVGRLLEKEPQRRPRDAREVTRVLDALHDGVVEGASEEALLALLPHDREPVDDTAETLAELLPSQATPAPSPTAPSPTAPSPTAPSPSTPSPTAPASATSSQAFERAGITPRLLVGLATALTVIAAAWWFAGSSENHRSTSDSRSIDADLDAHDHYRRGMDLLKRYDETGHIDAAIAEFQRALALDEASAPSLAGLARAYWLDFKAGTLDPQRLRQAAAAAESAVEHGEYFAVAHVSRGMVHVETGSSDAARADFERALELEPLHAEAHFGLALLHASQGDTTAAETAVRQAIEVATPPSW